MQIKSVIMESIVISNIAIYFKAFSLLAQIVIYQHDARRQQIIYARNLAI